MTQSTRPSSKKPCHLGSRPGQGTEMMSRRTVCGPPGPLGHRGHRPVPLIPPEGHIVELTARPEPGGGPVPRAPLKESRPREGWGWHPSPALRHHRLRQGVERPGTSAPAPPWIPGVSFCSVRLLCPSFDGHPAGWGAGLGFRGSVGQQRTGVGPSATRGWRATRAGLALGQYIVYNMRLWRPAPLVGKTPLCVPVANSPAGGPALPPFPIPRS